MDSLRDGAFCVKCLTVLVPLLLVIQSPVTKGQCTLGSGITDSQYMWWTETDAEGQELVYTFTDSQTCKRYVTFFNNVLVPSSYVAQQCEDCVSSIATSNNGVRYVAEQPSLTSQNLRKIICNELYPSDNKQVMIHRDHLDDERPSGSVTPEQCLIETTAARWIVRTQPGDLSLKQTATCPFADGSYRFQYGYNGNVRCEIISNKVATVRVSGSQMTFDASQCEDYVSDRAARGYATTDSTKAFSLPLFTTLSCVTGSEFPGSIVGRDNAGNLLLLADTDPPANLNLKRPWYYAANYEIIGDTVLLSISTIQSTPDKILIDPAQAPTRLNTNVISAVMYLTLTRQRLTATCNFPSQFERTWFVHYTSSGFDSTEIMYEEQLQSALSRKIYKTSTDKPTINEQICVQQSTGTIGSGSSSGQYYFYAMGDVPGELTCYAYMSPVSSITDKVLVRYQTSKGIATFAIENTCSDYMNTQYNSATDTNKKITLRVFPRIWLDNFNNGIFGPNSLFGNWDDSYKCPFTEGSYQAVYSESSRIFNQCNGDIKSFVTVNGNALTINTCAPSNDYTYRKPYHTVLTCIANWNAGISPHLPPGQGSADSFTNDHYVVLAFKDLSVGTGVMKFYCARYRLDGSRILLALNVESDTQTLCRTDVNAEAYESVIPNGGQIRQFTLTKFASGICDASPCQNDGTCESVGSNGLFTCTCHSSYSGDLCQFRPESLSEDDVSTTITIIVAACLVIVAIVILAVILRERQMRKNEKARMDTEYGRSEVQKPDNISTISADPKSNVSMNGSQVQAWFPDYRQNGK